MFGGIELLHLLVKDGLKFLGSWLASARLHVLIDVCYASRLETVIATVLAIRSKFERLANHVTGCLVEQLCALNPSKLALIQGLRDRKWSEIACKCKCRACNGFSCGLWNKYQPGWRLLEGVGGGEVGFERWKTRKSLVRKKPEKQRGKSLTVKSKSICLLKMKIGFYGLDLQGWLVKYEWRIWGQGCLCALPVYPVPSMRSTSVVAQHVSHPLLRVVSSRGGGLGATEELQVVRQMVVLVTWQPGATLLGHLAACERELSAESTCSLTIDGAHRRCLPPSLDPSSSLLSERRLLHFLCFLVGHHVPWVSWVRHLFFLVRLISLSRLLPLCCLWSRPVYFAFPDFLQSHRLVWPRQTPSLVCTVIGGLQSATWPKECLDPAY